MEKTKYPDIFLSFYGDDFTGSTDALESLTLNGLPAALFLQPPTLEEIEVFVLKNKKFSRGERLKAFGVPGVSRSMRPEQMSTSLPGIFEKISRIPVRFFHYKICSTFDSSPDVGNIGHAVDIALDYFPSPYIPLVVGAPALNRFCAFGNLFARVGETTYRLDRHPTMSRHPMTPMNESDLRLHLGKQTERPVRLFDVLTLEEPLEKGMAFAREITSSPSPEYLLFDVLNQSHLLKTGTILLRNRSDFPQLIVGSSGVENALSSCLQEQGEIRKDTDFVSAGKAGKVVVMAGSCSPGTQKQIEWALKIGFEDIRINSEQLIDPETQEAEMKRVIHRATDALKSKNAVLYTALGPDDNSIRKTKEKLKRLSTDGGASQDHLAKLQGIILKAILEEHADARVTVAGGDTSGHVSLSLEIYALEILVPIAPGAPLCLAHSRNPLFDGLQIALKGGQNGNEHYFESIMMGHQIDQE